jgi:hypothetical protein
MEISNTTCSVDAIRAITDNWNPLAATVWTTLPYDVIVVGAYTVDYGSAAVGTTVAQYNGGQSWIGADVSTSSVGAYFEGVSDGRIAYDPAVIVAFKNVGAPSTTNPLLDTANWTPF